ncbi:MAG: endonuclease III [Gemmatimonadetes bacterium]|nr:endonuclease III [Gemmatimonadota bacterium]
MARRRSPSRAGAGASPPGATSAKSAPPARPKRAELPSHGRTIYRRLAKLYPDARCELDYRNPFELAVATVLSAQCTDKRVNMVTPMLFARFPDARAMAAARIGEVEAIIKSTGFFRNKAKSITGLARGVVEQHGGDLPNSMDALVLLPGVGRKTANVILGNAFGKNEGVVVDTHIGRLARRLGFTRHTDPVKVEAALAAIFPRRSWTMLAHLLIWHGRRVCEARKPRCSECVLANLCPSATPAR